MKKIFLPFLLFFVLIIAAGCKTAPADKAPEPTSVEASKEPVSNTHVPQEEDKSNTMQKPTAAATMPPKSEKAESQNVEQKPSTNAPAASAAKTGTSKQSTKVTPQQARAKNSPHKITSQKAPKQSGGAAKNAPQAKNAQTKPAKQDPAQQKTAKSNASGASAAKTDTSKQSAKTAPQKAPAKESAQKGTSQKAAATKTDASKQSAKTAPQKAPAKESAQKGTSQKAAAAKTDTSKQSAKTAPQKAPAKESAQKGTPQKAAAQSESASKNKTGAQAKNAQTKPAKQEPTQQKAAKSKTVAENNKKSASPEAAKKEAPKTASAKQEAAGKAAPAKQPEKKAAEQKTKEPASRIAAAQITDIVWMIEQADASFVSKQHKGSGKMFVTMFAKYTGDLTVQDFQEALFASPADLWSLDEKNAKGLLEINKKDKLLTMKHLAAGDGVGAAALGKWFASVTLAGQKPFEKELNVTGIGGQAVTDAKKISFIVPVATAENEQQALTIPVIRSVSRDADTIEIIFSINDSRVKNAYFYFDVPGEEYYRDSGSMIDATGKPVNGCRSFSTDGKKCQYVLRKDASNQDWFGKATRCFLVVSDVNRMTSPWEERHRTISAASPIAK